MTLETSDAVLCLSFTTYRLGASFGGLVDTLPVLLVGVVHPLGEALVRLVHPLVARLARLRMQLETVM